MARGLPIPTTAFPEAGGGSAQQESARFGAALVELAGALRRRAYRLTRDVVQAEDLMQEALTRAWSARLSFRSASDLRAWTFTILRNLFLSQMRRSARTVELTDLAAGNLVSTDADQHERAELNAVLAAIDHLSPEQRDALRAVALDGLDYESAAAMFQVTQGALRSRVRRARIALARRIEDGSRDLPARGLPSAQVEPAPPVSVPARRRRSRRAAGTTLWIGVTSGPSRTSDRSRAP